MQCCQKFQEQLLLMSYAASLDLPGNCTVHFLGTQVWHADSSGLASCTCEVNQRGQLLQIQNRYACSQACRSSIYDSVSTDLEASVTENFRAGPAELIAKVSLWIKGILFAASLKLITSSNYPFEVCPADLIKIAARALWSTQHPE